jgi:hypothetical protein
MLQGSDFSSSALECMTDISEAEQRFEMRKGRDSDEKFRNLIFSCIVDICFF